jgi:tetratricopeptide (TPR) repeat protein
MSESVLWNEMGNLHMRLGGIEEAISAYGKAIELSPKFGLAYSNLGLAYYSKGKYDDAVSLYQKCLELSRTDQEITVTWKRLGDAYQKMGDYEKALTAYKMGDEFESNPASGSELINPRPNEMTILDLLDSAPKSETGTETTPETISTPLTIDLVVSESTEHILLPNTELGEKDLMDTSQQATLPPTTPPFLPDHNDTVVDNTSQESWPVEFENPEADLESNSQTISSGEEEFGELNNWLHSLDINSAMDIQDYHNIKPDEVSSNPSLKNITQPVLETTPSRHSQNLMVDVTKAPPRALLTTPSDQWESPVPSNQICPVQSTALMTRPPQQAVLELVQNPPSELFKSWKMSEKPEHDPNIWKGMLDVLEKNQAEQTSGFLSSDQSNCIGYENTSSEVQHQEIRKIDRELADSIENYRKITDAAPANDKAWDTLGKLLKDAGDYSEAVAAFERAITLCPNKDLYCYHLGLVYAAQKRHDDAIQAFQKVIELNPGYILAHCALAGSYRRLGMELEAETHIKVALPRLQAETEYNRACFEAICGNNDQAIELLKLALDKKQTSPEWVRGDPDLDFIRDDPRFKALVSS